MYCYKQLNIKPLCAASSSIRTTLTTPPLAPSLTPTMGVVTDMESIDYVVVVVPLVLAAIVVAVVGLIVFALIYWRRSRMKRKIWLCA